jgi:hypothetical protein
MIAIELFEKKHQNPLSTFCESYTVRRERKEQVELKVPDKNESISFGTYY